MLVALVDLATLAALAALDAQVAFLLLTPEKYEKCIEMLGIFHYQQIVFTDEE